MATARVQPADAAWTLTGKVGYGTDLAQVVVKPTKPRKNEDDLPVQPAVVHDELFVLYAKNHEVDLDWVVAIATEFSLDPQDIAGYEPSDLGDLLKSVTKK